MARLFNRGGVVTAGNNRDDVAAPTPINDAPLGDFSVLPVLIVPDLPTTEDFAFGTGIDLFPGLDLGETREPATGFEEVEEVIVEYDDWFLPSDLELNYMWINLYSGTGSDNVSFTPVGNFNSGSYWSSTEIDSLHARSIVFFNSSHTDSLKSESYYVRACRSFVSTTNYNLRDIGPSGGLIFWKLNNNYLEAAPFDCANSVWSNINNVEIGVTAQGTAIGTGQANTLAVIAQAGNVNDWFLPSRDELHVIKTELYDHGVGNLYAGRYWSSSEYDNNNAWADNFTTGQGPNTKNTLNNHVRACRAFTSTTNYNLRDTGPAGGWIFWKSGNNYLEVAIIDQSGDQAWSNIINQAVTGTGTAIGTGQANTTAIINQVGHTDSAAKLCDDLDNIYIHTNSAAKLCDDLIIEN